MLLLLHSSLIVRGVCKISVKFGKRWTSNWETIETEKCGRIMVATKDILPGSKILTEKCLMLVKNETVQSINIQQASKVLNIQDDLLCFYKTFQKQTISTQLKVRDLFCPTVGKKAKEISDSSKHWHVDEDTRATIVMLATVMSFNSYDDDEGRKLFALTSRFSHSCIPNCGVHFCGEDSTVRAILPIKRGDEMTLSYDPQHTNKPTHERRAYLVRSKEFLCNCPRCTSLGDDTRQFNCFNPKCNGRHCVCQSLSTDIPHILPCTLCNTALSSAYQACLLSDEATFSDRYSAMHDKLIHSDPLDDHHLPPADSLLHFPLLSKHHSLTVDIASERSMYYTALQQPWKAMTQARISLRALESFVTYPSLHVAYSCHVLGTKYEALNTHEGDVLARHYHRRAVQLHLLLRGREQGRDAQFDEALLRITHKISQVCDIAVKEDECAFCGVLKGTAHMDSACRCNKCSKGMYCSAACRTIHSDVHCVDCSAVL